MAPRRDRASRAASPRTSSSSPPAAATTTRTPRTRRVAPGVVLFAIFFLVASAALPTAEAGFKVEKATFRVNAPSNIQGTYEMAIANFGVPLYGAVLNGALAYPPVDHEACDPYPADWRAPKHPGLGASVVVVDRGDCAFTRKAFHAQQAGADAVMIHDNVAETLVTMDAASDAQYASNITVPVALITKQVGNVLEGVLSQGHNVLVTLNWTDVMPHPDERVEWELWTNSGDECGPSCDAQKTFIRDMALTAQTLERGAFTQFTPHYITWLCPPEFIDDPACVAQCINRGRYCCPDPDDDFRAGFSGVDVVMENLRSLCAFQILNQTETPWKWWDYATAYGEKCTMANGRFGQESCAIEVLSDPKVGVDVDAWRRCVGDPNADAINPLLEAEQRAQVDTSADRERGDIVLLPTVVINERQFRGKLERSAVLDAICAGFERGAEPDLCAAGADQNDACAAGSVGAVHCASDADGLSLTGCEEISRYPFYQCACPLGRRKVTRPDGNFTCEEVNECQRATVEMPSCSCERCVCRDLPLGEFTCHEEPPSACADAGGRSGVDETPGGCWVSADGKHNACRDNIEAKKATGLKGGDPATIPATTCACPKGFSGDGVRSCVDVDECVTSCKGEHMTCQNLVGSHECACAAGYVARFDAASPDGIACFLGGGSGGGSGGRVVFVAFLVVVACATCAAGGFWLYRRKVRSYMDAEIRAIMSQYMPLEDEGEDGEQTGGVAQGNPFVGGGAAAGRHDRTGYVIGGDAPDDDEIPTDKEMTTLGGGGGFNA